MNHPLQKELIDRDLEYAEFLERHPAYAKSDAFDMLRQKEYARLDTNNETYLDYTGGSLYPISLIEQHSELLKNHVFGNPHSHNNSSQLSSSYLEQARQDVLEYFHADPNDYSVIFCANASAALKLVAESYPFEKGSELLLTADNHNSVQGIREFARHRGANIRYIECQADTLLAENITDYLSPENKATKLLAYPAQSNFSGVQHPLPWIIQAKEAGYDVLLDAAAFAPTNRLDLSAIQPDFVSVSFYKIFGYPTGVGALIARRDALEKLRRPWFAGGTVKIVSAIADFYSLEDGVAAFEEGTVNYLNFPIVSMGLKFVLDLNIDILHDRVMALTSYLLSTMQTLKYNNGQPAIELYGPKAIENRGATIAFNIFKANGEYLHYDLVEKLANEQNIAIRSGCFCNPGAGESSLHHTAETINQCRERVEKEGFNLPVFRDCITNQGKATGAVRVSLGLASNYRDARNFIEFLKNLLK